MNRWRGLIEEYRKFLPVTERTPVVTLGEGNPPLIRASRLAKKIAPGVDLWRTRERAHFLRDALVRASHANDLVDPNDSNALNEPRALEVYRAAAIQALGENAVGPITIVATYSSQGSGI